MSLPEPFEHWRLPSQGMPMDTQTLNHWLYWCCVTFGLSKRCGSKRAAWSIILWFANGLNNGATIVWCQKTQLWHYGTLNIEIRVAVCECLRHTSIFQCGKCKCIIHHATAQLVAKTSPSSLMVNWLLPSTPMFAFFHSLHLKTKSNQGRCLWQCPSLISDLAALV